MISPVKLSLSQSRKLLLYSQGLLPKRPYSSGKNPVLAIMEQLGYIQIDTISVIQRAHHHTLWSRNPAYSEKALHSLQTEEKKIFEYWSHAAAYLPMRDFRFSYWRKNQFISSAQKHWFPKDPKSIAWVYDRIKAEGPLSARDFQAPQHTSGPWWGWKPAKIALEQLFQEGKLMIRERRNFQKVYDLTERVLPPDVSTLVPSSDEMAQHLVYNTLRAQGLASAEEMAYLRRNIKPSIKKQLPLLRESGEIVAVQVEGAEKYEAYALPQSLENVQKNLRKKEVHILSPFDNSLIQRKRLSRFFQFDYQIECYVPEPKRKYGYFSLPILWGDRFVGRMDTKADRKSKVFTIKNLVLEDNFKEIEAFLPTFLVKLDAFVQYNSCEEIRVMRTTPESLVDKIHLG